MDFPQIRSIVNSWFSEIETQVSPPVDFPQELIMKIFSELPLPVIISHVFCLSKAFNFRNLFPYLSMDKQIAIKVHNKILEWMEQYKCVKFENRLFKKEEIPGKFIYKNEKMEFIFEAKWMESTALMVLFGGSLQLQYSLGELTLVGHRFIVIEGEDNNYCGMEEFLMIKKIVENFNAKIKRALPIGDLKMLLPVKSFAHIFEKESPDAP